MGFRLREGLSWCLCRERLVLLDLVADRYLALPPALERAFLGWASGNGGEADGKAVRALLDRGILVPGPDSAASAPARVDAARRDLLASAREPVSAWRGLQAALAQISALRRLRRHSLAGLIRATRDRPLAVSAEPARAAAQIASAFDGAAMLVSKTDRCLPRALAAWSMCRRRGVPASLVFGVRVEPFAAHCWVQLGDAVLVGDFEQCRFFTPILVEP